MHHFKCLARDSIPRPLATSLTRLLAGCHTPKPSRWQLPGSQVDGGTKVPSCCHRGLFPAWQSSVQTVAGFSAARAASVLLPRHRRSMSSSGEKGDKDGLDFQVGLSPLEKKVRKDVEDEMCGRTQRGLRTKLMEEETLKEFGINLDRLSARVKEIEAGGVQLTGYAFPPATPFLTLALSMFKLAGLSLRVCRRPVINLLP